MKPVKHILSCSLLGLACLPAMACYTVYGPDSRVVYQGEQPPVDMSLPIHETVPARFPGGHMVFDAAMPCSQAVAALPARTRASVGSGTPLLTNQHTAQAMGLPYTAMGGGIALVQAREVRMAPGVTVLPAEAVATARARPGRDTVITEWRNPPVTTVEAVDRPDAGMATRMMGAGPAPRR